LLYGREIIGAHVSIKPLDPAQDRMITDNYLICEIFLFVNRT